MFVPLVSAQAAGVIDSRLSLAC